MKKIKKKELKPKQSKKTVGFSENDQQGKNITKWSLVKKQKQRLPFSKILQNNFLSYNGPEYLNSNDLTFKVGFDFRLKPPEYNCLY